MKKIITHLQKLYGDFQTKGRERPNITKYETDIADSQENSKMAPPQSPSTLSDEFITGKIMQNPLCTGLSLNWFATTCSYHLSLALASLVCSWMEKAGSEMKSDWISQSYREDSHYSTHYHLFLKLCPVQWQSCYLLIRSVYIPQALPWWWPSSALLFLHQLW